MENQLHGAAYKASTMCQGWCQAWGTGREMMSHATLQASLLLLEDTDRERKGEGEAGQAAGSPLKNLPRNIFG